MVSSICHAALENIMPQSSHGWLSPGMGSPRVPSRLVPGRLLRFHGSLAYRSSSGPAGVAPYFLYMLDGNCWVRIPSIVRGMNMEGGEGIVDPQPRP